MREMMEYRQERLYAVFTAYMTAITLILILIRTPLFEPIPFVASFGVMAFFLPLLIRLWKWARKGRPPGPEHGEMAVLIDRLIFGRRPDGE